MRAHINYDRLHEIENDLVSGRKNVERDGGHFCLACQRITELECDGPANRCAICGAIRMKFLPPVHNTHRDKPASRPGDRLVPPAEGHERFLEILRIVG